MLWSINSDKIKQALNSDSLKCILTCEHLEPRVPGPESVEVYGTISALPASSERARDRLLSLRQNLIDSGVKPLSVEELQREINDTRGRS